jgi:hypothetical protein
MNVVNHLICVWHCCGSHLEWVFSLNYDIMLWFATTGVTRILSNNQKLGKQELQKLHNDKHIWTSTPNESCETPCMCLILISGSHLEWVFNLNNGTMLWFATTGVTRILIKDNQKLVNINKNCRKF